MRSKPNPFRESVWVGDTVEVVRERMVFGYDHQIIDRWTKFVIVDGYRNEETVIFLAMNLDEWANDLATRG